MTVIYNFTKTIVEASTFAVYYLFLKYFLLIENIFIHLQLFHIFLKYDDMHK